MLARPAVALAAAGLLLFTADAWGARARRARPPPAPVCPAAGTEPVVFAQALAGDRFLTTTRQEVRLVGLHAPPGREDARLALDRLLRGRPLALARAGAAADRYGRIPAQVFAGGAWVQGLLLKEGLVLAAPDVASAPCAGPLLAAEAEARTMRTGGWYDGRFRVLDDAQLMREAGRRAGTFQIVEGTVMSAAVIRGRAYLNFGEDWRSDVTVTIAPEDMRGFRTARVNPRQFAGQRLRVRGWIELFNGPNLQIATPGAIEVIGGAPVGPQQTAAP